MDQFSDFDQQASVLLEKSKGPPGGSQSLHASSLNASTSILVDNISSRIVSIEEKLNTCDSIYRLATQSNTAREKEKREQFQIFIDKANEIDQKISKIDGKSNSLDVLIQNLVHKEVEEYNKVNELNSNVDIAISQLNKRLDTIQTQFLEGSKRSQKEMKKLKIETHMAKTQTKDDGRLDEIIAQLSEIKRRQMTMLDLLNTLHNKNFPDFQNVNTQLSQLWTQISTKRGEATT
ncbi:hypothetical protein M9Y10_017755 [Tritrichomonas musculus]|uniref:Uncharacterized protein n=1 Tax=Tritrichomonas musculus TaxID=1915356 RepID=A0ABR2HUF0_9EUKA